MVRESIAPELSPDLLERIYLRQREHQFSRDRQRAIADLDRLIDAHLDQVSADLEQTGTEQP